MDEIIEKPVQSEETPLDSWKRVSSLILSSSAAMICLIQTGSVLLMISLFIPIRKIFSSVLNNKIRGFISGTALLFLFPIAKNSVPLLIGKIQPCISFLPENGQYIVSYSILYLAMMAVSSLIASIVPCKLEFPKIQHNIMMLICFGITIITGLAATVVLVNFCNGRFVALPGWIGMGIPFFCLITGGILFVKAWKLVFSPTTKSGPEEKETSPHELSNRSTTKLSDVAGMEDVKQQIRLRLIEPLKNPKLAEKYGLKAGGGVLLYGPPGTGKTFLARAVAGELDLPFFMITAADVFSKYVGESENKIKELFDNARKHPLSVIFIDEMEIFFAKRTEQIHEVTQKVISIVLQELDGVDQSKNPILILGATNTPWKIDEAFLRPGRFDILAFVDLPDAPARHQILASAFKKGSLKMESGFLEYITENTKHFSGADLNGLATRIRQQAYESKIPVYTKRLAYEILLQTHPSVNKEICDNIRKWENQRKSL